MHASNIKILAAALLGALTAVLIHLAISEYSSAYPQTASTAHYSDEVHVHADFSFYIQDERVDLTAERYQSSEDDTKHLNIHLHDNVGHVIHRHAHGITFADFLSSIGFTLTDACLTMDTGEQYCSGEENTVQLFVNGTRHESPTEYIIQDEDQVLLYYGPEDAPAIDTYLSEITSDACIYSETCPERGTPPPESCGATCEI